MLKPFRVRLGENVLICDGAMGTQLYSKGVFLNRCFDELNLSRPTLVREVHQEYFWAGAEILETNTFGANRIKLEPHGLAAKVREINLAGVRIAREVAQDSVYVGGAVGPLGIRIEPYGKMGVEEAQGIFAEQIQALAEGGVDLLCLETFSDLNEIRAALLAAKEFSNLPVMAQMTLEEDGNSLDGSPPETFGVQLEKCGADIIGVNCGVGPQVMLESIERLAKVVTRTLCAQPSAGKPRNFEGRNLYLSSPEYMASYARRFIQAGVQVVGGCCGTTPAHIKAMRGAVHALKATPPKPVSVPRPEAAREIEVISLEHRSRLARLIQEKKPVVIVDMMPPQGGYPDEALEGARLLKASGVDAIKISDAPRASARMSAIALAILIEEKVAVETMLHYTCRDRNLLAMQSELLGAYALGLRNLLLSTGDPIRVGDYIDATAVFDVDSIGLTRMVRGLNQGRDVGGKSIGKPTGFYAGVSVNPAALDLAEEIRRMEQKVEAGAQFAITQPIFRPDLLEKFIENTLHCQIPIIGGIWPLARHQDAEFLNNEVPGISIPESLVARMHAAGSPENERDEGVAIAREIAQAVKGMVRGIQVHVAAEGYDAALEVLAN